MKGFIDRVDEVRDAIRIIDYKSGSGTTTFSSIESLFDKEEKDRAKAVMQVFMYCWMYAHLTENKGKTIQPGIYYVRSLFADPFDPSIYHRVERGKSEKVEDFSGYSQTFEEGLRGCLDEIFNPRIPLRKLLRGRLVLIVHSKVFVVSSIYPSTF